MTVSDLISKLKDLPPGADVVILYDGEPRMDVEHAYLAKKGDVIVTGRDEAAYSDAGRPLAAPSAREDGYWQYPEMNGFLQSHPFADVFLTTLLVIVVARYAWWVLSRDVKKKPKPEPKIEEIALMRHKVFFETTTHVVCYGWNRSVSRYGTDINASLLLLIPREVFDSSGALGRAKILTPEEAFRLWIVEGVE